MGRSRTLPAAKRKPPPEVSPTADFPRDANAEAFLIKTSVPDPRAAAFSFSAQKKMYGGKGIAAGDATVALKSSDSEARASVSALLLTTDFTDRTDALGRIGCIHPRYPCHPW